VSLLALSLITDGTFRHKQGLPVNNGPSSLFLFEIISQGFRSLVFFCYSFSLFSGGNEAPLSTFVAFYSCCSFLVKEKRAAVVFMLS